MDVDSTRMDYKSSRQDPRAFALSSARVRPHLIRGHFADTFSWRPGL